MNLHIYTLSHYHIYTFTYLPIYIFTHLHIYKFTHSHTITFTNLHIYTSVHLHICTSVHLHICTLADLFTWKLMKLWQDNEFWNKRRDFVYNLITCKVSVQESSVWAGDRGIEDVAHFFNGWHQHGAVGKLCI